MNVLIVIALVVATISFIGQFFLLRQIYRIEEIAMTHRRILRILIEHSSNETKIDLKKMQQDVHDMHSPTIIIK